MGDPKPPRCDEAQPTCERCRKGGRDCAYPEPKPPSGKGSRLPPAAATAAEGDAVQSDGEDEEENLSTVADEEEYSDDGEDGDEIMVETTLSEQSSVQSHSRSTRQSSTRKDSEPPSLMQDKSPSPSTAGPTPLSASFPASCGPGVAGDLPAIATDLTRSCGPGKLDWSHLPSDVQFYLNHHRNCITEHTYSLRHDGSFFVSNTLLEMALHHKPLLYAVVGFSAFHYALNQPNSKLQDFLGYYTESLSYLRTSLQRREKHSVATLVTILQLATVEENLGDWPNLKSHQKAACEILTKLYTPESMMQSDTPRVIFDWYSRFDLFAGLLAGSETVLTRDWFTAYQDYYSRDSRAHEDDVVKKMDLAIAAYRKIAMDMATLFAHRSTRGLSPEQCASEQASLTHRLNSWWTDMDPSLTNLAYAVSDFSGAPPHDPDDIVDPYAPGVLLAGPLWRMNFAIMGWRSTDLMLAVQTAQMTGRPPPPDIEDQARKVCQMFEAIELWPGSPRGSLLPAQASLGIASLFLPKDERHTTWLRKKFALIESMGYIYPPTFRQKLAALWSIPSVADAWLPDTATAGAKTPKIIYAIRAFVVERQSEPTTAAATADAADAPGSDLRQLRGIFKAMDVRDTRQGERGDAVAVVAASPDAWGVDGVNAEEGLVVEEDGRGKFSRAG
ncbi:MAG: hypothetical protein M1832_002153 [Thelocarpon impressellum]|nr:MAG: hypothetical protein M1832_002153 [Thelocarpon impressellum]